MPTIELEKLLAPVSADNPCGEDLEYDPEYMEVFKLVEGTRDQEIGSVSVAAEEPNWRELFDRAAALAERTRDLRLGTLMTLCALRQHGVAGLRDGLALLEGLISRHWDGVYPKLDPDDNNDPTMRVNVLDAFIKPPNTFGDTWKFQSRLIEAPLVVSPGAGKITYRDILLANGEMSLPEGAPAPPTAATIDGGFMDAPLEQVKDTEQALREALEHVEAVDREFTGKVGSTRAVDLSSLKTLLRNMHKNVASRLEKRLPTPGESPAGGASTGAAGGDGASGAGLSGDVRSADEVILALDKIIRYYETFEPSSPIPLLVKRVRRLVKKSFVEIIKDLSPDAINQLSIISGVDLNAQA